MSVKMGQANSMIVITDIVPGRVEALKVALEMIRNRKPADSPIAKINTIHYASWAIIDGGERLLFTTNFDGDWGAYLDTFLKEASVGLNAIWENCREYPGAESPEKFKDYVKAHEVNVELFHAAYPEATVKQVQKAIGIQKKFKDLLGDFS